jgi:hypothetical protein
MSAPPWNLRTALRAWAEGWQAFFHQPCDGRLCAALRIGLSALTLLHFAVLYPDLTTFFTDDGVLPLAAAREVVSPYAWSLLYHLPQTRSAVELCYWSAVLSSAALLLGIFPRLAALATFVWLVSFQNRNFLINDGEDALLRVLMFLLVLVPTGHCWALPPLLGRIWRKVVARSAAECEAVGTATSTSELEIPQTFWVPGWGRRLIQLEMVGMFFSAGLCKLGGHPWLDGTALYYVARLDDFFGKFPVPDYAVDHPVAVACLTWSVLLVELIVPVLIWFRQTRRACLLVLLLFHLANEWTMHLFLFHWIMLCGWLSFLEVEDYAWLGSAVPKPTGGRRPEAAPPSHAVFSSPVPPKGV